MKILKEYLSYIQSEQAFLLSTMIRKKILSKKCKTRCYSKYKNEYDRKKCVAYCLGNPNSFFSGRNNPYE